MSPRGMSQGDSLLEPLIEDFGNIDSYMEMEGVEQTEMQQAWQQPRSTGQDMFRH